MCLGYVIIINDTYYLFSCYKSIKGIIIVEALQVSGAPSGQAMLDAWRPARDGRRHSYTTI